jgi:isopentenyl-diphosphate delta-isomerase
MSSEPHDPKASESKEISLVRGRQSLIVVDKEDNFLEYANRSACHLDRHLRHRAVVLFIYNDQEKILLQKRNNELFSGLWDLAGATHPLHQDDRDESYEESVLRCLKDEWGISSTALPSPMTRVMAFTYFESDGDQCENEYCVLFQGQYNGPLDPNPDHVDELKWVTWPELQSELEDTPEQFTPWLKVAVDLLNSNVLHGSGEIDQSFSQWASLKDSLGSL